MQQCHLWPYTGALLFLHWILFASVYLFLVTGYYLFVLIRKLVPAPIRALMRPFYIRNLCFRGVYGAYKWHILPRRPVLNTVCLHNGQVFVAPWYTYPALAQLERLRIDDKTVLEFGVGSSTIYFANRGCRVIGIEDNLQWFRFISKESVAAGADNRIDLRFCLSKSQYILSQEELRQIFPNIVVIDGKWRTEIAAALREWILNSDRIPELIVLDNADWHPEAYSLLASLDGFVALDYFGHAPSVTQSQCTSFFFNTHVQADILPASAPVPLVDGIRLK